MKRVSLFLTIFCISFLLLNVGLAQFPKLKIKVPKKIPGLDKILKKEPVITTSISDALTGVPFLDDYDSKIAIPMRLQSRTPDGGFIFMNPGNYMFEAQSFCLAPGKGSPSGNYGYLYTPLKGKYSDIIRNILKKSYQHPEISRSDIQILIWGIISRTKISDMDPEMQLIASKLLTPKEIFRVNGGALGLIPEEILDKAIEKLPPQARRVIEAEAKIREMLTKGYSSYEELERIAVIQEPVPPGEGSRDIPSGRWSLHPEGFFIRYFPRGYSKTLIEVYVPGLFKIERDKLGRIVSITGGWYKIETVYDDSIKPYSFPQEPGLKAYAFKRITYEGHTFDEKGGTVRKNWENKGWTFLKSQDKKVETNASPTYFSNLEERYNWYKKHKDELISLNKGLMELRGNSINRLNNENLNEILDLSNYMQAIKEVTEANDNEDWVKEPRSFVKEAWMSYVSKIMIGEKEKYIFDPAEDPSGGNTGEQPLGESGRGTDKDEKCNKELQRKLKYVLFTWKTDVDDCNNDPDEPYICDTERLRECIDGSSSPKDDFGCFVGNCEFGELVPPFIPSCLQDAIDLYRYHKNRAFDEYKKCMQDP